MPVPMSPRTEFQVLNLTGRTIKAGEALIVRMRGFGKVRRRLCLIVDGKKPKWGGYINAIALEQAEPWGGLRALLAFDGVRGFGFE